MTLLCTLPVWKIKINKRILYNNQTGMWWKKLTEVLSISRK